MNDNHLPEELNFITAEQARDIALTCQFRQIQPFILGAARVNKFSVEIMLDLTPDTLAQLRDYKFKVSDRLERKGSNNGLMTIQHFYTVSW